MREGGSQRGRKLIDGWKKDARDGVWDNGRDGGREEMIYGKGGVWKNRNRTVRGRVGERQGMRVEGMERGNRMKEGKDEMEERTEEGGRWREGKRDRERNGGGKAGSEGRMEGREY